MGSSGSFVAILLSVPLTAVALVGVVGVPKLQEMISPGPSQGEDEFFNEEDFAPRSRSRRGSRSGRKEDGDAALWGEEPNLDEKFGDDLGSEPKSSRSRPSLARGPSKSADEEFESDLNADDSFFSKPHRSRAGQSPQEPEAIEKIVSTEPFGSRASVMTADHLTPSSRPAAQGRPDGFAAGIEKLRAMGVERFHLEPGLAAGQFLFVCQVEAAGESTTIHRFEAEAADPAVAVADVTKQLADWQAESSVTKTAGMEFGR